MKFDKSKHGRMLMYLRPIRIHICERHQINEPDLEMLLYLFGVGYFKRSDFKQFQATYPFDYHRFNKLLAKGWFHMWRKNVGNKAAIYELTQKGKQVVIDMYRKIFGEQDVSELYRKTEYCGMRSRHMKAVNSGLISRMNKENKQQRQTPE